MCLKKIFIHSIFLFLIESSYCSSYVNRPNVETIICKSIEIQNLEQLEELSKCDVVVGHVSISNLQITDENHITPSTVQEITDFLLVYRVNGIKSLEKLFPKLLVVRGMELLFDKYSLVIHENVNLINLGLISLLRIQRGSIRIESNPNLCYVNTIDWTYITENTTGQHFSSKRNKSPAECPSCRQNNESNSNINYCWHFNSSQNRIDGISSSGKCSNKCDKYGCDSRGVCCDLSCITSCSPENCLICKNFVKNGICVETCNPPYYQMNKRECITAQECYNHNRIPHTGHCIEECPLNYKKVIERGRSACKVFCNGTFTLHKKTDLMQLSDCSKIEGSLVIELKEAKANIISDLESVLRNIKEITGYLKISQSPQLVSLNFFRNLDTIKGDELIDGKYALSVVDNYNLEDIWADGQKVVLIKGQIYFHLNPKLCYDKIMQLESSIKSAARITFQDVSPNSNGERVICGDKSSDLNVTIVDFNATAVLLKMQPLSYPNPDVQKGYSFHYKVAPQKNVTRYDGRHGCGVDEWQMEMDEKNHHIISNLKPFTQYAFFVKTISLVDYHSPVDAYSAIQYFKTLPSKPGSVAKLFYQPISETEMVIHWWPPRHPNGIISKYYLLTEQVDEFTPKKREQLVDCDCPDIVYPDESDFMPDNDVIFDKPRIDYTENLPNIVYSSRRSKRSNFCEKNDVPSQLSAEENKEKDDDDDDDDDDDLVNYQGNILIRQKRDDGEMKFSILRKMKTETETYSIIKPLPICMNGIHDENCEKLENIHGLEIPGHVHMYRLDKLMPNQSYKISIRACVSGLANGCGRQKSIRAQTTNEKLEKILNGLK